MKTLVLLSGGLDSAVVLATCVQSGHDCATIGFDYGQPHRIELERAELIAEHYRVPFSIRSVAELPKTDDVVFSGRNLVFASIAVGIAQERGFESVAVGCNASDWLRFPDCRPAFWNAFRECASAYGVQIATPLLHSTKVDVVAAARKLNVPIDITWSCYEPIMDPEHGDHMPCERCLACKTRQEALQWRA